MIDLTGADHPPLKPGWIGVIVVYLIFAAVVLRTLAVEETRPFIAWYLGLELSYLILFTLVLWFYKPPRGLMHLYLIIQSALVFGMLSLQPEFDYVVLLFLLLTYQISMAFAGRLRWVWIGIIVVLTGGSLMFFLGVFNGLALSLTTIAAEIVLPAYLLLNHEIEMARSQSQKLLDELQESHRQLQAYADQVEELATMQERSRLAREIHETVSQLIFSISLTTRSAQLMLDEAPARLPDQLERLQAMSTEALSQLRSLIGQLRPSQ